MRLTLAPQAEADLDEIWYYIATESSSASTADRFLDSITSRFLLLSGYPYMGRSCAQEFGLNIRTVPISEYLIFYTLQDDAVSILRIVHGRRDLNFVFPI
jgi:toxin ParE1/3/4